MRTFLGILVGIMLAAGVIAGCGYLLVDRLKPLPAGFDPRSLKHLGDYVAALPREALLLLACAGGLAALIGAWPAARIARPHRGGAALTIAVPFTVAAIVGAALVPQPAWVPVLGMLLPIPLAIGAWRLAIPRAEL